MVSLEHPYGPTCAAFALAVVGWGCSGGDNDPATGSTLEAGSKVVGVDGVTVGAPVRSLEDPVEVRIARVDAPEAVLAEGLEFVGPTYRVATEKWVRSPADSTFVVGIPLPEGVDPADAAIAAYAPEGQVLDQRSGDRWMIRISQHESDTDLLLLSTPSLRPEGLVARVVVRSEPGAALDATAAGVAKGAVPLVLAKCSSEFNNRVTGCTTAVRAGIEAEFGVMHGLLSTAGFPEPALDRDWQLATSSSWLGTGPAPAPYLVTIDPCVPGGALGSYWHGDERMSVCVRKEDGVDDSVKRTTRHELFHATQHAFPAVYAEAVAGTPIVAWGMEGQAALAERSTLTQLSASPDFTTRPLAPSLFEEAATVDGKAIPWPYMVQDFWGYLGTRLGGGLGFLIPFLERGHEPLAVDEALMVGIANSDLPDLATAYWEFAKNQAFEWQVPLDGSSLAQAPCEEYSIDGDNVPVDTILVGFRPSTGVFGTDAFDSRSVRVEGLEPLSGQIVNVFFLPDEDYLARISPTGGDPALRYKIYDEEPMGCEGETEDTPRVVRIEAGGAAPDFFVLLANSDLSTSLADVFVEVVRVEVAVDPERLELGGTVGTPVAGRFSVLNGGDDAISYTTTVTPPWLTITQNGSAAVAGRGTVEVSFEATCAAEGTFQDEIALEFQDNDGMPVSGTGVPETVEVVLTCEDGNGMGTACELGSRNYSVSLTWTRSGGGGLPGVIRVDAVGSGVESCDGASCDWTRSLRHVETRLDAEGETTEFVVTDESGVTSSSPFSGVPFTSIMLGSFCSQTGEVFPSTSEAGTLTILAPDGSGGGVLSWSCSGCSCFDAARGTVPDGCCPIMCQPIECEVPDNFIPVPSAPGCTAGSGSGFACGDYVPGFLVEGGEVCEGFVAVE